MSPLDRRQFVGRSLALLGAGSLGALAGAETERTGQADAATSLSPDALSQRATQASLATAIPFEAPHQAGILTPAPAQATFIALDAIAPDRQTLAEALEQLSVRARQLTVGGAYPRLALDDPPSDSGVLGPINAPDALTVTIAFGGSLFDSRYGLSSRRPRRLIEMPNFPNDALDPGRSNGDLLIQICAGQRDTVVHTLRELVRSVRGAFQERWGIDGFSSAHRGPTPRNSPRNLFAFRDGTANPDVNDAALMNRLVWVQGGAGEPPWATGGSYQVVRAIRMHVEFWDRVGLAEQEEMIGRHRESGAPLGGTEEFQDPRYDLDPQGKRIPLTAHIRVANPRTPQTEDQRILRRGFNYHRGFDAAGQLDQGLMFVAFNQDIDRQFATIQRRLAEEPMVDYINPVGGGYFFAPPGARGPTDWVGSGLFV
jgi:deferrochelatase/peroxidase EfeB